MIRKEKHIAKDISLLLIAINLQKKPNKNSHKSNTDKLCSFPKKLQLVFAGYL